MAVSFLFLVERGNRAAPPEEIWREQGWERGNVAGGGRRSRGCMRGKGGESLGRDGVGMAAREGR